MSPRSNGKPALGQRSTSKQHVTSMSYKLEPAIWSRDTGQWIPCFDRCRLIIIWMSNIREVHSKPRLHVSAKVLFRLKPLYFATPSYMLPKFVLSKMSHESEHSQSEFYYPGELSHAELLHQSPTHSENKERN